MNSVNPNGLPAEIDVHQMHQLLQAQADVVLLDCRTESEYAVANIPGARWIPMDQLQDRLDELMPLRHQQIVVHCHHGGRSEIVTQWLRALGFHQAQNLAGGIDAWSKWIDPSVPRY